MANVKSLYLCHTTTTNNYAIIKRNNDGYYLNDSGGDFDVSPVDPYVLFYEDTIAKGLFYIYESRKKWIDGEYTLICYQRLGSTPNPSIDTILSATEFTVMNDNEITNNDIINVSNALGVLINNGSSIAKVKSDLEHLSKQINMILPLLRDIDIKMVKYKN